MTSGELYVKLSLTRADLVHAQGFRDFLRDLRTQGIGSLSRRDVSSAADSIALNICTSAASHRGMQPTCCASKPGRTGLRHCKPSSWH